MANIPLQSLHHIQEQEEEEEEAAGAQPSQEGGETDRGAGELPLLH